MTTTTIEQFREQCAKTIELFDDATMRESNYMLDAHECADIIRTLPLPVMPEQAEPVAKRELIDLYKSVNNMMLAIGMHGVVESHNKCVKDVMNALYALDDGYAIIRANDLAEKAFVPFNQAFPKAVSEYIDKLEGRLNTSALLARIAALEAEIQKLKEDR